MLNQFILHLSLIENIGPVTVNLILKHCFGFDRNGPVHALNSSGQAEKIAQLYRYTINDWAQQLGCSLKIATCLTNGLRDQAKLVRELALLEDGLVRPVRHASSPVKTQQKLITNWCTIVDPHYPPLLKQLPNAPVVLYWWGDYANLVTPALAIVGSRQANQYAWQVLTELVPSLVAQQWVIVSGGALGADTMAHRITLQNQGRTVAVLGSGLLQTYPASNRALFQEIIAQGGTVLSPFSLNQPALVGNFPARNNIISGLSLGTIVVQAALKSGARITAECALNQGRELFVVPGLYGDPLSAGCHSLVAEGAKLIHSAQDILVELPNFSSLAKNLVGPSMTAPAGVGSAKFPPSGSAQPAPALTTSDQLKLACRQPISTDELLEQFGMFSLADLQGALFELQLDGQVQQNFAGLWQAI